MQSEVDGFKDVVYTELFNDAPPPARNAANAAAKKAKPGPLSRKMKLKKPPPPPAKHDEPREAETNGANGVETNGTQITEINGTQIVEANGTEIAETNGTEIVEANGTEIAETNGTQIAEANGTEIAETNGTQIAEANGTTPAEILEPLMCEARIADPAPPTEFPPTELFEPSANEPFPADAADAALEDSAASTAGLLADQSVTYVEVCVSPSAFPLDESQAAPLEAPAPAEQATPTPRALRDTPRDYGGFLSVSSRPSIRESTPCATANTPRSFLRCRDDPATPFAAAKRRADSPAQDGEAKRAKAAAAGFFARVTAPIYRAFAVKEGRGEEDEGIEAGEEVLEGPEPPRKYCVLM